MVRRLTPEQIQGLGVALNEATLLGVEVDAATCRAAVALAVLALPSGDGPPPEDPRVQFVFTGVGRIAASLRAGYWNDDQAPVEPFALDQLLDVVRSFGGVPIYGWEFFDVAERDLAQWGDRLSLDWRGECGSEAHSIALFQEGDHRHLDLVIWFEDLRILDPAGRQISPDEFSAAGKRWWDAFYERDPRTQNSGMVPLG